MKNKTDEKEEEKSNKGLKLTQKDYKIEVKYSKEAIDKKLMRFTATNGTSFEISADEMISFLVNQVNSDTLKPTFVDIEKINVVQVLRQIKCVLDKDMKKGEEILLNYFHPYPLEFAIIEESYKIAKIELVPGVMELKKEFIDETKKKIKPEMEGFIKKFYQSFKNIDLGVEPKKE